MSLNRSPCWGMSCGLPLLASALPGQWVVSRGDGCGVPASHLLSDEVRDISSDASLRTVPFHPSNRTSHVTCKSGKVPSQIMSWWGAGCRHHRLTLQEATFSLPGLLPSPSGSQKSVTSKALNRHTPSPDEEEGGPLTHDWASASGQKFIQSELVPSLNWADSHWSEFTYGGGPWTCQSH